MFPTYGAFRPTAMYKFYYLVILGVCILDRLQSAKCEYTQRSYYDSDRSTRYRPLNEIESPSSTLSPIEATVPTKIEAPIEAAITGTEPSITTTTSETETSIDTSTTGAELLIHNNNENESSFGNASDPSISTTTEAVKTIERNPAFEDLDLNSLAATFFNDQSFDLYLRLIDIFNQSRKLSEEFNRDHHSTAVLLLGKAGSGKTTLANILAGNISSLTSHELTEDSGDYYIDGGSRINHGVESNSVLPYLIKDNKTGVVFIDNPGFNDADEAFQDLAIALNIKTVAESFKYVRIALVCPHSSLKKGVYRSELTNFLQRIADFIKNSERHLSGISLVATNVRNSYSFRNGEHVMATDSSEIQAMGNFLNEVKLSHSRQSMDRQTGSPDDRERSTLIVKILQNLLQRKSVSGKTLQYKMINILRSPKQPGPLINQSLIMDEREAIRDMLLDNNAFEPVVKDGFGVAISAKTRDNIDTLFRNLDSYIVSCTEEIGRFLKENFLKKISNSHYDDNDDVIDDIQTVITERKYELDSIQSLKNNIEGCRYPTDFVRVINAYMESHNLTYDRIKLDNILTRYEILRNVEYLSSKHYLSSKNWQNALKDVEKTINNELLYQLMLQETFHRLREYKIEKRKTPIFKNMSSIEKNPEFQMHPKDVITELNLPRYACLEFNREKEVEFNQIVMKAFVDDERIVRCERNLLIIINKFVFVSEIEKELENCYFVDTVVLLAADTVIIDSDLSEDELEGRHLLILGPHWEVQGERRLIVSGKPHEKMNPSKASAGEVGMDGEKGNPSGDFRGVGLIFKGADHLTVQACGGNGQDGQNGGDGEDGKDGKDDAYVQLERDNVVNIPIIYQLDKTVITKTGQPGTAGQNSGAGGRGGVGGTKGSVSIVDLASNSMNQDSLGYISKECEGKPGQMGVDGRPGNSGSNGCSSKQTITTHGVFKFEFNEKSQQRQPCEKATAKGEVVREPRVNMSLPKERSRPPSLCRMLGRLRLFIGDSKYYYSKLTMRQIDEFQRLFKEKLCQSS